MELIDFIDKAVRHFGNQSATNYRNVILNEQEFLDILHKRFVNKYGYQYFNKTPSTLYLNNFFPFLYYVGIGFCYYEFRTNTLVSSELSKKIIEIFEYNHFKTNKNYEKYTFYLDQQNVFTNDVSRFEKVTNDLLEMLLKQIENNVFFFRTIT